MSDDEIFHAPPGGFRLPPTHPGRTIAKELIERDLSANAFALKLGMPASAVVEILQGTRSISAETALRIARYFGTTAQFWLNLQTRYDLAVAERDLGETIAREVEAA